MDESAVVYKVDAILAEGSVQGTIRWIQGLSDCQMIEAGDIVAMDKPDTIVVTALDRIGGLATRTGGQTSHLACVAREMGIPYVVSTHVSSELLGCWGELDGNRGQLSVHSPRVDQTKVDR